MTSRCKDTTHARRSNFDLECGLNIKVGATCYYKLITLFYYSYQFPPHLQISSHTHAEERSWNFENTLNLCVKLIGLKWPVKQTARMSTLIPVVLFTAPAVVSGHWTSRSTSAGPAAACTCWRHVSTFLQVANLFPVRITSCWIQH